MNSGNSHSNPADSQEDGGSDRNSWDTGSGEGSASALARMKSQERTRTDSQSPDEGPNHK